MSVVASPFEALGLPETATEAQVKEAWRKLASQHHPDRGGDADEFGRLRKAYDEALELAAEPLDCSKCEGTGYTVVRRGFESAKVRCGQCGGTGEVARG